MTETYLMWVNGQERSGQAELCHASSPEDVDETIQLAQKVFQSGIWSKASPHARADVLEAAAALLAKEVPNLIPLEVRQTGRAVREMRAQVPSLVRWFKYYAALLRTEERAVLPTVGKLHNWLDRVPLGVVAQITPFNHPLLIAVKKLAPALAAGNCVVAKPSELTPLTTLALGKLLKEAGLPDGVFNVLPGYGASTGKALVQHPLIRKVDVTGGTVAGRAIGSIAGGNLARYTAELGGKAPLVVFAAADIDVAVNGITFGSFMASGQTCIASTRIIVENAVLGQVLEKLKAKIDSIARRMGSPNNPESMMGPLISAKQLQNVTTLVDEAVESGNATALTGGKKMSGQSQLDGTDFTKGYFFEPTVLVSSQGGNDSILRTRIWREEAFGPVIAVVGFDTEDQAITLANDSEFGLGASVWTKDLAQGFRSLGGAKSASGIGSENGVDALREYTTMKSTIVNYASAEESLAAEDWFGDKSGGPVRYG
ncbi:aldehyde dehydrogenase [Apiospora marii]|uniref:aldehyde dehydrogenase n=1 Tax=Apiospora marii TaxID=335849 RepID=UPI00312F82E1